MQHIVNSILSKVRSDVTQEKVLVNQNSEKLLTAFKPVWWFLLVMGQMPFRIVESGTDDERMYNFRFATVSLQTIIYGITFLTFSVFYLLITIGISVFIFSGYTNIKKDDYVDPITRQYVTVSLEKLSTRDQLIPMFVIWALMTITFSGFITVFLKGRKIVQYFNYWNSVVQIIDIDPTLGVRKYFIYQNLISVAIFCIFTIDFLSGFQKFAGDQKHYQGRGFKLAAQEANMVFGMFHSFYDVSKVSNREILFFACTFIIMIYGIVGSRVQIIPFIFYSQLLKNASEIWNERLRNLIRNVDLKVTKQSHRRVDYANLLKDHLVIVQLFKMTENTFSLCLIAFYLVNLLCIILEMYYLVNILLKPLQQPVHIEVVKWNTSNNKFARLTSINIPRNYSDDEDYKVVHIQAIQFLIITVLMLYQVFTTYQVTYQATQAYQHAMKGFAILRKHGFLHCRNKTERNFIHTLVFSFARNNPLMITGGGYFPLNNTLIIAMIANMINYVIFMYQKKPDQWEDLEYNWNNN